jgi:hypothetical protein
MRGNDTKLVEPEVEYTSRPMSGWCGLLLPFGYFRRIGVVELLAKALPDGRVSPNQVPVVDQVLGLFATILAGGRRFSHVERLRDDEAVRSILGVRRIASSATLTRYFAGFVQAHVERLSDWFGSFLAARVSCPAEGEVLDLDSTIFERYGSQEGSLRGHNPRKHGRPSHHPLLAFLATSKRIAHVWLRSGNAGTARGVTAFLAEVVARLPAAMHLNAVRADSGFFVRELLEALEERGLAYAIAARNSAILRRFLHRIGEWRSFADGLEAGEVPFELPSWGRPRRLVVVREQILKRPEARGRKLFDFPEFSFHFVVTTLATPPEEVWRFYNGRADSENRIKEFKNDFGAGGFCLQSFYGTEAVLRLNALLFNLIAEFRESFLESKEYLATLRYQILVVGGALGSRGRRRVLRLGLRGGWRRRFESLRAKLLELSNPTAMQHLQPPDASPLEPQRPWRLRGPRKTTADNTYLPVPTFN